VRKSFYVGKKPVSRRDAEAQRKTKKRKQRKKRKIEKNRKRGGEEERRRGGEDNKMLLYIIFNLKYISLNLFSLFSLFFIFFFVFLCASASLRETSL